MSTLTPVRSKTALMDGFATASRTFSPGIRDLLRDTALLVTRLSEGGHPEDAATLRQRCQQLMASFAAALDQRGFAADVREDAALAQCGLLDEAALRNLSAENKPVWDAQPLQVERFGKHDAGERVFERLEQRMREPSANTELLECYAAILGLGFMGRYAREGETKRAALMASLNTQLEKLRAGGSPAGGRPLAGRPFFADHTGRRLTDWFYRLSPWAIAGLACVAAAVIWLIWAQVLDAHLAQLSHLAPAVPTARRP
ncbi:DotU family type IV/VI secretion system protein (plasmid) [Paraburkholderia sprentiae WSM5005]|uniref:DotU family type IV/VI secretion system protein n=1 Tax=Paraburkholderia sprentiae WSM5005 TaxID=754502 RepID=A0A1I9YU92_9BURK|nr:DotU family type IV/VI secretion system protein [Paraburkholderia sprentiae]APA89759.1 DotU family type IV/VI secretion system protein [Paraburkholderia sprentiae WSM5005]